MTETLFVTSEDTVGLATPAEYVDVVRDAYRQVGEGAPAEPRTALPNADPLGFLTAYIAILPEMGAMGGYTYSAGFGAGDAWFITPVFDADTGEPVAVVDGAHMNPFKTGAVGAVGVDALAREDAATLGVIGSGKQARGQVLATDTVRDFDRVRVYSRTQAHREAFAADLDDAIEPRVTAAASSSEAVGDADVVITATTASDPVFDGDDLKPGAHVTAVGQYNPEKRELDATTIARAKYVPDLRARAFQDAGSFLLAIEDGAITEEHLYAELGDVVAGAVPGRESAEEITVFDSGGTAIETVSAAYLLAERARDEGLGSWIDFAPASDAMPDPGW